MTWPWSMTLSLLCAPVDGLTHVGGVFGWVESVVHVQHVPKYAGGDLPHRALCHLTEHVVPHLTEERWWNPCQPIYNSHIINNSQLHLYAENYFFPFLRNQIVFLQLLTEFNSICLQMNIHINELFEHFFESI